MILIFSISQDPAANGVTKWLSSLGHQFIRINHDELHLNPVIVRYSDECFRFRISDHWVSLSDLSAVWYRKGLFWFQAVVSILDDVDTTPLFSQIQRKLERDNLVAAQFFHYLVADAGIRCLGNPFLGDPNKLIVLSEARRVGLKVPDSELINQLAPSHLGAPSEYIAKAVSDGIYLWDREVEKRGYFSYAESLDGLISALEPERSFPISLVQRRVRKAFEIRVFYLDGEFMSCAILSQSDPQTSVDYRKYNLARPNRNVPYQLPPDIADKLDCLFRRLGLNTGSVDMIVDEDGSYVFLEINPVGMYGNLVTACNYNVDKAIADWLIGDH